MKQRERTTGCSWLLETVKLDNTMGFSYFIFFLAVYIGVGVILQDRVNSVVPEPYMDEIFHVPQCEKMCKGNFSYWDPKITTLPGAYLSTVSILGPLNSVLPYELCTTFWMRSISLLFSAGNMYLIYQIIGIRWKEIDQLSQVVSCFTIATFPVLYFFSFLYYTDVFSTFFLLLTYKSYLQSMEKQNLYKRLPCSSLICFFSGAMSIFVRQTNIIWVNYIFLDQCFAYYCRLILSPEVKTAQSKKPGKNQKTTKESSSVRKIQSQKLAKEFPMLTNMFVSVFRLLNLESYNVGPGHFNFFVLIPCGRLIGFALIDILFVGFVFVNNGIAVGDRTAHQVKMNFPQILYFLLFTIFMAFPIILSKIPNLFRMFSRKRCVVSFFFIIICFVIVYYNTVAHPYLLADNRHYPFYVWKRLFQWHPAIRYALIPVYLVSLYIIVDNFDTDFTANFLGVFIFLLCCILNLVPQLLLEFRYFIPGYLIFRLNIAEYRKRYILLELIWYSVLNASTMYIFLSRTFFWPTVPEPQRFMW